MKLKKIIKEIIEKKGGYDEKMIINKDDLLPYYNQLNNCRQFKDCEIKFNDSDTDNNFKTIKLAQRHRFKNTLVINNIRLTPPVYVGEKLYERPDNDGYITPTYYNPKDFTPYKKIVIWFNPESNYDFSDDLKKEEILNKVKDILDNPKDYIAPRKFGIYMNAIFDVDSVNGKGLSFRL